MREAKCLGVDRARDEKSEREREGKRKREKETKETRASCVRMSVNYKTPKHLRQLGACEV